MIAKKFSAGTRELIADSRRIAIELGNDFIGTHHLVLACCRLHGPQSIKDLLFPAAGSFEQFYKPTHIGAGPELQQSFPLSVEAEKRILYSAQVQKKFGSRELEPTHLMLSCFEQSDCTIYPYLGISVNISQEIEAYYIRRQCLNIFKAPRARKNWFQRILNIAADFYTD